MKIAVVGTGYVGLVSGTCFAETGNHVVCVDNNEEKVRRLQRGEITIYEPGLEAIFHRNIKGKRLHFTQNLADAVADAEIIFLALPTPPDEDGSADLSYVLGVAVELAGLIKSYKIIVNKSTVPVGTAEKVRAAISTHTDVPFDVVSNPEFLREGVAVEDFLKPNRVIIGTSSEKARQTMAHLYKPFVRQGNPIFFMDERSAEVTKYAANAYLATRITFMNEIANLCGIIGADVDKVRMGMGSDSRIGKRFLFPGVGYGGSCFPKDVQALEKTAQTYNYPFSILKSVMAVNDQQKKLLAEKIIAHFGGTLSGKHIAIWGLAFKPNTDDVREAPAIYIVRELLRAGAKITAFDPEAIPNFRHIFGDALTYTENRYDALKNANALAIVTEWGLFRSPDFERMGKLMDEKVIFDGRNLYQKETLMPHKFTYYSIGRPKIVDGKTLPLPNLNAPRS